MTPDEIARKLRAIARLETLADVDGWRRVLIHGDPWYMRPPFDGEIAALTQRKMELEARNGRR